MIFNPEQFFKSYLVKSGTIIYSVNTFKNISVKI